MPSHRVLLELTRRYGEPHRHYHSIEHIAWMLEMGRDLSLSEDQILAIWFHDAVFEAGDGDNEQNSADLAAELLAAEGYPPERIASIEKMILDTKAHRPTTEPSKLVVDLDLASLGVPWDQFTANTDKVEREYAGVSSADIDAGRRMFFEEMLARERIFSTEWGAQWEEPARANIRRALEALGRG